MERERFGDEKEKGRREGKEKGKRRVSLEEMKEQDPKLHLIRFDLSHSGDVIYFDNMNSSPMPSPVLKDLKESLDLEHMVGREEVERVYSQNIKEVYNLLGTLIHSFFPQEEIALMDSISGAWTCAFMAIPLCPLDIVLISKVESGSNYIAMLHHIQRIGANIMYIPTDSVGAVSTEALKSMLESLPNIKVVCLTCISASGVLNDIYKCGQILTSFPSVYFLVDATYALGQQIIDVQRIQCQMLIGSSNFYLRGPSGISFIYVSQSVLPSLVDPFTIYLSSAAFTDLQTYSIHSSIKKYERIPENISLVIGFSSALKYYLDPARVGADWCSTRVKFLNKFLLNSFYDLQQLSSKNESNCREIVIWNRFSVETSTGEELLQETESFRGIEVGVICFTINGIGSKFVRDVLRTRNIFVSICSPETTFIDSVERRLPDRVRLSIHYFNTEIEIFIFCEVIKELIFGEM